MWWQIFNLTFRIPDRPRLVGIVYVFLTGASMRIVQLDTRIPGIPVSLCTNKTRTSVLDIMISVCQLTIGLNMSQVILACSVPVYQILQDDFPETKKIAESDFGWTKSS
jgi:hypothetical protein